MQQINNLIFNYVSRETFPILKDYVNLVKKWNRKTGLVQIETLDTIWERHILDCLQIIPHLPNKKAAILDIGTGGGFPGILLAIAGYMKVNLCESNIRKVVFLEEVIRQLNLPTKIINQRVENISESYDYITSRACAKLGMLLRYMNNVSRETGSIGIFLKGKTVEMEVEEAQQEWVFDLELIPSITAKESKIIIVRNLAPKLKGHK